MPAPDLFPPSVEFVLSNETFERDGQLVSLFEDPKTGECSNWGISLAWLRGLKPLATPEDIKAISRDGAVHLYRTFFWEPVNMGAIAFPMIAAKVFDAEVNMGSTQGIRLLQRALRVEPDGILGPVTAAACNADDEADLYRAIVRQAADRYQKIHDEQVKEYGQRTADLNLSRWLGRLAKVPKTS
ncbi:MAG: glycosyl hydrolase 108 family protein [Acidobacteriota bacterium]